MTDLAPARTADVAAAVAALPLPPDPPDTRWGYRTATATWLTTGGRRTEGTRKAYFFDLARWLEWCDRTGLDPRVANRADVDAYTGATFADLSGASKARKLSVISSWYRYLASIDLVTRNPVDAVERPVVDKDDSPTVALTGEEVTRFMRAARRATGPNARRNTAVVASLAEMGLRVSEAIGLDMDRFRHNRGHRTVRFPGKGGKWRELPIPAPLGRDLDAYFTERAAAGGIAVEDLVGPAFVTSTGKRLDRGAVFRLVRETATAAGLPNADQISPHSLRHTVATAALDAGAQLRDVQDLMGHADPRTTRRYDRSRGALDRSPLYLIAGLFAHDADPET